MSRLLAAAVLAAMIAALNAGSAAALGEQCSGTGIAGEGGYLQQAAQQIWLGGGEFGFNESATPRACNGTQGEGGEPGVSYTPVGSGPALHDWGVDDGVLHNGGVGFITTEEPPAGPVEEEEGGNRIGRIREALGSEVVVAPLTQTAIAIVAHPPALPLHAECLVEEIVQADLEAVFSGQLTNWRQLATASDSEPGGDCDQAIVRVVREEAAGTTYQFKHFLDLLEPAPLECTGATQQTWAQLQSSAEPAVANVVWPSKAECQFGEGPVSVYGSPGAGETAALAYVQETAGTITYGSLPEAAAHAGEYLIEVYNGAEFVAPEDAEAEAACGSAEYALPPEWEEGINVDWSQVYGSDPEIAEAGAYPICTLSWAVAPEDPEPAFGAAVGTTVRDYLRYALDPEGGQEGLPHQRYAPLPTEVAEAAALAVAQIGPPNVLCAAEPELEEGVLICPEGQGYAGLVVGTLAPKAVAVFKEEAGVIFCESVDFAGLFDTNGTSGYGTGLLKFRFSGEAGCTSTIPALIGTEPVLSFDNPPYTASRFFYLGSTAPEGLFTVKHPEPGSNVRLRLEGAGYTCFYKTSSLSGSVTNGTPTKLQIVGSWTLGSGGGLCPASLVQSSPLQLSPHFGEAGPFYVSAE